MRCDAGEPALLGFSLGRSRLARGGASSPRQASRGVPVERFGRTPTHGVVPHDLESMSDDGPNPEHHGAETSRPNCRLVEIDASPPPRLRAPLLGSSFSPPGLGPAPHADYAGAEADGRASRRPRSRLRSTCGAILESHVGGLPPERWGTNLRLDARATSRIRAACADRRPQLPRPWSVSSRTHSRCVGHAACQRQPERSRSTRPSSHLPARASSGPTHPPRAYRLPRATAVCRPRGPVSEPQRCSLCEEPS